MRMLVKTAIAAGAALALAVPAQAQQDASCNVYSEVGGAMADFMLPLSLKQVSDLLAGRDQVLASQMGESIVQKMPPSVLETYANMPQEDAAILGEAAGLLAIDLIVSGRTSDGAEIRNFLTLGCNQAGSAQIIASYKQMMAANPGQ
ncbi:MAG: hypothetical protein HKN36_13125 [Hellea sp.]|nr:hypothetical protein [Hellea sp.]